MTNAERFIGDEDLIDTFIDEFNEFVIEHSKEATPLRELMVKFFQNEPYKGLTVDEQLTIHEKIDEITASAIAFRYNEKEKAMLQEIIKEQQKQIEDLKWRLDSLD